MELIDRKLLRNILMREQARYILSDRMTDKHISAGFMLAIAELDSQPTVLTVNDDCDVKQLQRRVHDIQQTSVE